MTLITRKSKWTSLITTPGFNRFQNWISWPARSTQICKFLEEEHLDARKRTEMEWKRGIIDPCGGEFEKQHWHSQEEPVRRMIWSLTPSWRRMWSMRKCKYLQWGSVESHRSYLRVDAHVINGSIQIIGRRIWRITSTLREYMNDTIIKRSLGPKWIKLIDIMKDHVLKIIVFSSTKIYKRFFVKLTCLINISIKHISL